MSGNDAQPGSQAPRRGGFWTFWTTVPGILTGIAALVTAVVGLITVLHGFGGGANNAGASDHASGLPSQAASLQTPSASGPTAASSNQPQGVFVQGTLRMKSPDDADLEQGVVGLGVSGGDLYLYCSGQECLLNAIGSGLMTTTDGSADKSACTAALNSRHDQVLDLPQLRTAKRLGRTLCVQTEESRIAALQILGVPGVGTPEFAYSYTVWD
jgi:hypothetical protein